MANNVCLLCLRELHTWWTFRGPRIRDIRRYLSESLRDYAIRSYELNIWTFDEQELLIRLAPNEPVLRRTLPPASKPPPHHRFG